MEDHVIILHGVTFIINFFENSKIHIIFKKKIYVNVECVRRPFSNRCVSTKRDAQWKSISTFN